MHQEPEDSPLRSFQTELDPDDDGILDDVEDDLVDEDDSTDEEMGDPDATQRPDLKSVFAQLESGSIQQLYLTGLSDLDRDQSREVRLRWFELPNGTRERALDELNDLAESRFDMHFGRFLRIVLEDPSAVVRQHAVAGLWTDEGKDIPDILMDILANDPSADVRIQATQNLATVAVAAELGELSEEVAVRIHDQLFDLLEDDAEPLALRRRALEAVSAYGSSPRLDNRLLEMYEDDDTGLRSSAVYAMGQSLDRRWYETLLSEFANDDAEVRYEAARAIGHFGDTAGLPGLAELATDDDDEVRQAAIAAIGEIGGTAAKRMLQKLSEQAGNIADLDAVQDAIVEATIVADPLLLSDDEDEEEEWDSEHPLI